MTPIEKAIKIVGNGQKLADHIGVINQAISNWKKRNQVPADRCIEIEKLTKGEVRCEELRPDIDWGYLRKHK